METVISVGKSYLGQKAKPVHIKKNQIPKWEIQNSKKQLENLDRNKLLANESSVCIHGGRIGRNVSPYRTTVPYHSDEPVQCSVWSVPPDEFFQFLRICEKTVPTVQKYFFRILFEFKVNFSIWSITWWFDGWYSRSPTEVWSSRRRNFQFILFNSLKVYAQIIWCTRNRNHVTTFSVILTHKLLLVSQPLWLILYESYSISHDIQLVMWMESSWFVNTVLWSAPLSLFEIDSAWYRATCSPMDKIAFSCPAD